MTKNITIFKNIKETDTPFYVSIHKILNRIKDGKSKELVEGQIEHPLLRKNRKNYRSVLYIEFNLANTEFDGKSKISVTKNKFNKWLEAYSVYKFGCIPHVDRDRDGWFIRFRGKEELEVQGKLM